MTEPQETRVPAPISGIILDVMVGPGAVVHVGDEIMVIESMKMEIPIEASTEGTVARILVKPGDHVSEGDLLAVIA